ncbi:hypothetical protein PGB90_002510 [Kerria lacca]
MAEENFEEVCNNIKACINSSQRQTSLSELSRDYKSVLGDSIPFRSLGYSSLEQLIRTVPDLKITSIGNELYIDVKPDEKTMHITKLVRGQKSSKKKKGSKYGKSVYRPFSQPYSSSSKSYNNNKGRGNSFHSNQSKGREDFDHDVNSRDDENYFLRKYRSIRLSEYDFSTSDGDDFDNFEESSSEDGISIFSSNKQENENELSNEMNKLHVTLGTSRKVSVDRISTNSRKQYLSKNNSVEDDVGHVSMRNQVPIPRLMDLKINIPNMRLSDEVEKRIVYRTDNYTNLAGKKNSSKKKSREVQMKDVNINEQLSSFRIGFEKGDFEPVPTTNKLLLKRTPAAIVAAGRALIEPNVTKTIAESKLNSSKKSPLSVIDDLIYGEPFTPVNKPNLHPKIADNNTDMSSYKKSLTKTITPMSFENKSSKPVPSKMSDLNMFKLGPNILPNFSEHTWCYKLRTFINKHNLSIPEFTNFTKYDPKTKTTSYMCKVKIGSNLSFASCPFESSDLSLVQEHAAKKAYNELSRRHEIVDPAVLPVAQDKQKIVSRITEIVTPYTNGLKSEMIETKYKLVYQEILPFNWLDIVRDLSLLSVEQLVGGIFVYPSTEVIHVFSNVTTLPTLILPEKDTWNVFITCCSSTNNIYFRIIDHDYNGRYETMAEKMEEIYAEKKNLQPVDKVKEGNFYIAFLENELFRIKILGSLIDKKVRVSLIDYGDIDEISIDCIYPLNEQLTDVPAQAVRCGLTDLEQYSNHSYITKILYDLVFMKSLVAQVDSRNPYLLLTFFDTSTSDDVNINEFIKQKILKELSPPKLPSKNILTEVHLTSILEDGLAFVQIISESFKFLKSLLSTINQELSKNESKYVIKSYNELVGDKIFLVKYTEDNMWHRAFINNLIAEKNEAEVIFVDYGNVEIVSLENIVDIKYFTEVLGVIPPQAVQVRYIKPTNELFTQTIIEFLMRVAMFCENENTPRIFVMKVVKEEAVPDIELYVRLLDNNKLVSMNDIIGSYYPDYREDTQDLCDDKLFLFVWP